MSNWTMITGASGGIGADFAEIFASSGNNLVLVARSTSKLDELAAVLKKQYQVEIICISKDLSKASSAQELVEEIAAQNISVHTLVNNAGVGLAGSFYENDAKRLESMIHLNMTSLTILCRAFIPDMISRGSGGILNVASTAAFQAGPYMSVYYASKAYVLNFTEGLAYELKDTPICVSCLCPGPTKTHFFNSDDLKSTHLKALPWMMSSKKVAAIGYHGLKNNKIIVIPGLVNWLMAKSTSITPRFILRSITGKLNS
ncbi:MAG: SDR family oxidoreductase [Bacteriovoracaceae bacterium]|nr:SDR family oxidoreductase [Bacteriovoracaceae bacterium]